MVPRHVRRSPGFNLVASIFAASAAVEHPNSLKYLTLTAHSFHVAPGPSLERGFEEAYLESSDSVLPHKFLCRRDLSLTFVPYPPHHRPPHPGMDIPVPFGRRTSRNQEVTKSAITGRLVTISAISAAIWHLCRTRIYCISTSDLNSRPPASTGIFLFIGKEESFSAFIHSSKLHVVQSLDSESAALPFSSSSRTV